MCAFFFVILLQPLEKAFLHVSSLGDSEDALVTQVSEVLEKLSKKYLAIVVIGRNIFCEYIVICG